MKFIDRLLQRWRISKVRPYLRAGDRVLDIGSADGPLFDQIPGLGEYIGIDPDVPATCSDGGRTLVRGLFPKDLPDDRPFDAITLLAVLEHIPPPAQDQLARDCAASLKLGGYLLITVPSPSVDCILAILKWARLIDGMSLEQHFGFDPKATEVIFTAGGLKLQRKTNFQLGLNHLFVFTKP